MMAYKILIFGNVNAAPFINNLSSPVRAFQRIGQVKIIEPSRIEGFISTGGAKPNEVPRIAVIQALSDFSPDIVICLGGALFLSNSSKLLFKSKPLFAGFAFSDPFGLEASLEIAREFDLFYTQDPQTIDVYLAHGIKARRCDPAIDPELYRPIEAQKDCDILFYGKWTPYRNNTLRILAERFQVKVHAYQGETRWSVPVLPPLNDPQSLCEALNRSRLALEIAVMDDATGQFKGASRMTNRVQFAAACEIPSLIEYFDRLPEFFEPGVEISAYHSSDELLLQAEPLLHDASRRSAMGRRARERLIKDQTWHFRVQSFLKDTSEYLRAKESSWRFWDRSKNTLLFTRHQKKNKP